MFTTCDELHRKSNHKETAEIDPFESGDKHSETTSISGEKNGCDYEEAAFPNPPNYSQAQNIDTPNTSLLISSVSASQCSDEESDNIYEEVYSSTSSSLNSSAEGNFKPFYDTRKFKSSFSNRKSLVDEVMYEVEKVQRQHAQVLKELNLEMENMIMPVHSPASSPVANASVLQHEDVATKSGRSHHISDMGTTPAFFHELTRKTSAQNPPPLPARTNSSPRFSFRENAVSIEEEVVTSTPLSKCKWMKMGSQTKIKNIDDSQDNYSDESIYEDIDQYIPDKSIHPKFTGKKQIKDDSNQFWNNSELVVDRTNVDKNVTIVGFSSIKDKLRNVKHRMSKNKESNKERWSVTTGYKENLFQNEQEFTFSKMPQDIKPQLHPPYLPPVPKGLLPDQLKRRCIISTLVHSENTYFATLKRLLHDYKKPLEESHPPILNKSKIDTLFYRIPEIQQCHAMFRIALADCVKRWDKEEKIGDVFVASFSKSMVLEIYSDFINNFSIAMELAKTESKRKSAFADFLKVKQLTSHDRLSFFGLMVKPVQRFPQFIMLLQDLLKLTPHSHCDRLNLQLALTQLESLAEMLNERKRESEQHHAVQEVFRNINARFLLKSSSDSHFLIREDNVLLLKFDQENQLVKTKERRLYLLNNLLLCVAVSVAPSPTRNLSEKFTLKWAVPVTDVEIQEEISPTLNRMVTSSGWGKQMTPKNDTNNLHALSQEMANLMHDFEIISRISALVSTLKKKYEGLNSELMQSHLNSIMQIIQTKDEEMKWIDDCCLQLLVPLKSKNVKELVIFQTSGPKVTKEWIIELHLSQLALDVSNTPAWDTLEQERLPSTKMPLFARYFPVFQASYPTEVKSACYYTCTSKSLSSKIFNYLWVCSSDGVNSHICVLHLQQIGVKQIVAFDLNEVRISTMEAVPGSSTCLGATGFKGWTIWMGTDSRRILMFSGSEPERHESLGFISVSAPVLQLCYYWNQVFASLTNGNVIIFRRLSEHEWQLKDYLQVTLSTEPVTSLLPFNNCMYCACGRKVWMLDCATGDVMKNFPVHHEQLGNVYLLAQSGIGLWINLRNTSTICLYHMETFKHLQDINIASNINRILAGKKQITSPRCIFVTSLLACRGLLWVGTNVGVLLTIPLPRLEGVPIISGQPSLSYHTLVGPVTTLISITVPYEQERKELTLKEKNLSSIPKIEQKIKPPLHTQQSMPAMLDECSKVNEIHSNLLHSNIDKLSCTEDYDVYGLYGDLLNVSEYEDDEVLRESLRRSEPDLLPTALRTLDRQVELKAGRPKSLDLTSLSQANQNCSSSSSETSLSTKSFASNTPITVNYVPQFSQSASFEIPKTVMVLMGGRGYANVAQETQSKIHSNDAHILFWEMKY